MTELHVTQPLDCKVLVIGAGPVGLTLALDLAARGIDVTVVEQRARGTAPEPKCNHVSARSMEVFRRLGLAAEIRAAGLPEDFEHSVSYRTTFIGPELTRIYIPSRGARFTDTSGPDCNWPTPEPPHRINQIYLEPILFRAAAAHPRITILSGHEATDIAIGDDGARLTLREGAGGATRPATARYLVGCDGARSAVRKAIGAEFTGDAVIQRVQSTFIRAPGLLALQGSKPAWGNGIINPRRSGMVYAIDGDELWLVHNYLRPDEEDFEAVDRDWGIRTLLGVPADFRYEIISKEDWFGRRLVANRFRNGCAFIAGDACHIWVPYAGFGMNAGIADATNLSWLLAAALQGWAGEKILDAYEAERMPITEQVSRFAMAHAEKEIRRRGAIPERLEEDSAEGEALRRAIGALTYEINVQQYAAAGLNFGVYYDASPIIAYDTKDFPPYTMADYTPSTVPGCRMPHVFLPDGRSLYDSIGLGFGLVRTDRAADPAPLVDAAQAAGMPLTVVDVLDGALGVEAPGLVLVRPDQVVAWRGVSIDATSATRFIQTFSKGN
jgi:2-polyprenyl-6-methoxyphenol hydroxylase-like FAD-dependent oxidoreductase